MRLPATIGILALFLLAGCGGGGSDGASGISYTGSTSAAAIDNSNAEAIGLAAYQGAEMSSTLSGPMSVSPGGAAAGSPRVVTLVLTLQSLAGKICRTAPVATEARSGLAPKDIIGLDDFIDDGLGGSLSIAITADNVTGVFTGTFTFSNYHPNADTVLDGGVSVSGHYDTAAPGFTILDIRYGFSFLTLEDAIASVTVDGAVEVVNSAPSASATVNLVFRDNTTGKTIWIRDYTMDVVAGPDVSPADGEPDYIDVSVAGRVYIHDYGYVDIATTAPLRIYPGDENPDQGIIEMTGSADRKVRMVVIDAVSGFDLEADLDANGSYEWTSPGHPWA